MPWRRRSAGGGHVVGDPGSRRCVRVVYRACSGVVGRGDVHEFAKARPRPDDLGVSIRNWMTGMKTVLAKPPHSVSAVMPLRALSGPTRRAMTAKAGS